MKVTMRVDGLDKIAKLLREELPARVSRNVHLQALKEGAEPIRAEASARAPRAPGAPDLAENIGIGVMRGGLGGDPTVGIGVPRRLFYYDLMQEFGTVRHGAQPFYRPALDTKAVEAIHTVRKVLWHALISRGVGSTRASAGGAGE